MYGLISRTGVPSTISVPIKWTQAPSIDAISTKDNPIAHGRCGDRVLNTPTRLPFNLGGATFDLPVFASLRWKKYMIQRCENCSNPSRACSGLLYTDFSSSTYPVRREPIVGWRGTPRFSGKAVRILPIGLKIKSSSNEGGVLSYYWITWKVTTL